MLRRVSSGKYFSDFPVLSGYCYVLTVLQSLMYNVRLGGEKMDRVQN